MDQGGLLYPVAMVENSNLVRQLDSSFDIKYIRGTCFIVLSPKETMESERGELVCHLPPPLSLLSRSALSQLLFLCGAEGGEDPAVICGFAGKALQPYSRIPRFDPDFKKAQAVFLVPQSAASVSSPKPSLNSGEFLVKIDRRWVTADGSGGIVLCFDSWTGPCERLPGHLRGFNKAIIALRKKIFAAEADVFYAESGTRDLRSSHGLARAAYLRT